MRDLGFTPCRADGDLWMRVAVDTLEIVATTNNKMPEGERYDEYVLIHVDDLMVDSRRSEQVIKNIRKTYRLNKDKKTGLPYGPNDIYLGSQIRRHQEPEDYSDSFYYAISDYHYVNNVVSNIHKNLKGHK